jgi:hypothetical protein
LLSTTPLEPEESKETLSGVAEESGKARGVIAWSSFLFAILQSVCTFFVALDGLRLLIGVGSLASVVEAGAIWDKLHVDWIRIPMMLFALVGSVLTLTVLIHVRHLRGRPASQWRQRPLSSRKMRMERLQLLLSVVTLALIAVEEIMHLHTFHRL